MSSLQVKFCGFRTLSEVKVARSHPVTALGFILVPGRRRKVSADHLFSMVQAVPSSIWTVGVLQNPTRQEVSFWMEKAPLSALQLHGNESPALCRWIKTTYQVRIIKCFHAECTWSESLLDDYHPWIDVALLDRSQGGTGERFDWNQIPAFQGRCRKKGIPLWIAGGIDEGNVRTLLENYRPDGIDLSSGIELSGKKDPEKMKRMMERIRDYE